jgi:hypothetical protein
MFRFLEVRVSYQIVTPESAAEGDVAEHGFVVCGQEWPLDAVDVDPSEWCTAHEALRILRDNAPGGEVNFSADHGRATFDGYASTDYRTGAETMYAVHVSGPARLIRALIASHDR